MDISKPQISTCDRTQYGKTCQRWDVNWPHTPNYKPIITQHNNCASPDGDKKPWCYTTDPNVRWDYCHPQCEIITTSTTTTTTTTTTMKTTTSTPKPAQIGRNVHHHMIIPGECGAQQSNKLKSKISKYDARGHCLDHCYQSVSSSASGSYNGGSIRSMEPTGWKTSLPNETSQDGLNDKIYYADDKATSYDFPWFVRVGTGSRYYFYKSYLFYKL